jgi:hypothetical protein
MADLTKRPTRELQAEIAEMQKVLEQQERVEAHPEMVVHVTGVDGREFAIFTGVPRPPDLGKTDLVPPAATPPSSIGDRDRPETSPRRQINEPLPPADARPSGPQPISVIIRDRSGEGMPDDTVSLFYAIEKGVLRLCHGDARDVDDGQWKAPISAYENPEPVAERLVKQRAGVMTVFNATKIHYADPGKI